MNVFIFDYVAQLTGNYHSGGGLVVFARDPDHVRELVADDDDIVIEGSDWAEVKVFPVADTVEPQVYVFPDAGCC